MRTLKGYSENRKSDAESLDSRKIYLFHTNLSPNSITLVIYTYRLRLPFSIPSSPCYLTIVRLRTYTSDIRHARRTAKKPPDWVASLGDCDEKSLGFY